MIKIEETNIYGMQSAVYGARNPLNSWAKSDSGFKMDTFEDGKPKAIIDGRVIIPENDSMKFEIGPNDLNLLQRLSKGGSSDRKYLRQIFVSMNITAPLYWWKEMDQYKIGTVTNSCSTMHTLTKRDLYLGDFSIEMLTPSMKNIFETYINVINSLMAKYRETKNQNTWKEIIQMLPSSFNQMRTWTGNYEILMNIYNQRINHKLSEWREFCSTIRSAFPYFEELCIVPFERIEV